ncbi:hypothetical protein [Porphyromonas gingivalis]|uniref:hypothetical protein n=1 Tax=Porphyromonas gingivalis TaxID=837 RepID=UPI00097CDEBA|nr:hypothetical protein [Porphyromonas gingivalis]SJM20050.1 hypothetical protein PGIN_13-1_01349 [Porphyromonas gingivalis]
MKTLLFDCSITYNCVKEKINFYVIEENGKKSYCLDFESLKFPKGPYPSFVNSTPRPTLEDLIKELKQTGLTVAKNCKNQGEIIFQAETDFMGHPAVGVKIYKTANNDYECVLSKLFNPPCAPLYKSTLEEIFKAIENLKACLLVYKLRTKQNCGSTPNPDF